MSFLFRGIGELTKKFANLIEALAFTAAARVQVESSASYTGVVIHGSRPHVIIPHNALALAGHGFGPVAIVHHPGTSPNNFPQRARDKVRPLIIREYAMMATESGIMGVARAEAAKIVVGKTLLAAMRAEAPKDTGNLAKGLHLVGSISDLL